MPKRKSSDAKFLELTQDIDIEKLRESIKSEFKNFPDPREKGRVDYPAWYILLVILCGYLAGGNTLSDIAHFAELKKGWFTEITGLTIVPCYDTIWWFLVRVDSEAFKNLLKQWLKTLPQNLKDQLLVVDGKRLRGISSNEHISHVVELFASESCLTLAQEKVPDKASERVALPKLLDCFDVQGSIVSMDALYAHISDLQEVLERGADYIVGIKGNQKKLVAEIENFFIQANAIDFDSVEVTQDTKSEIGHGRDEKRRVTVAQDLDWLPQKEEWGLQSLIEVRSKRVIKGAEEMSVRYYGSSRLATAKEFAKWIRGHWLIENGLHYILDVIFKEDASLCNTGYSAENISLVKRLAMNVVQTFDPQRGMANARRSAMHEPKYLRGLLAKAFC